MNPHGIYIFYKAYGDNIVVLIPYHLELELLPAHHGLLKKDLVNQGCGKSPLADRL